VLAFPGPAMTGCVSVDLLLLLHRKCGAGSHRVLFEGKKIVFSVDFPR